MTAPAWGRGSASISGGHAQGLQPRDRPGHLLRWSADPSGSRSRGTRASRQATDSKPPQALGWNTAAVICPWPAAQGVARSLELACLNSERSLRLPKPRDVATTARISRRLHMPLPTDFTNTKVQVSVGVPGAVTATGSRPEPSPGSGMLSRHAPLTGHDRHSEGTTFGGPTPTCSIARA